MFLIDFWDNRIYRKTTNKKNKVRNEWDLQKTNVVENFNDEDKHHECFASSSSSFNSRWIESVIALSDKSVD